jgi:hypothetical protein
MTSGNQGSDEAKDLRAADLDEDLELEAGEDADAVTGGKPILGSEDPQSGLPTGQ